MARVKEELRAPLGGGGYDDGLGEVEYEGPRTKSAPTPAVAGDTPLVPVELGGVRGENP